MVAGWVHQSAYNDSKRNQLNSYANQRIKKDFKNSKIFQRFQNLQKIPKDSLAKNILHSKSLLKLKKWLLLPFSVGTIKDLEAPASLGRLKLF